MSRTIWRKLGLLSASSMLVLGGGCIGFGGGEGLLQQLMLFAFDSTIFRVVN